MIGEERQLPLQVPPGFDSLSREEQLRFLAALWDRVRVDDDVDTEVHEAVVSRVTEARLAQMRNDPSVAISAGEVLRRVRSRLGS